MSGNPNLAKPPLYSVGDEIGWLTVTQYMGHLNHRFKLKGKIHHYRTACRCGEEVVITQYEIKMGRSTEFSCKYCTQKQLNERRQEKSKARKAALDPDTISAFSRYWLTRKWK